MQSVIRVLARRPVCCTQLFHRALILLETVERIRAKFGDISAEIGKSEIRVIMVSQ